MKLYSFLVALMLASAMAGQVLAQQIVLAPDSGSSFSDRWKWGMEQGDATLGYTVAGTSDDWGSGSSQSLASALYRSGAVVSTGQDWPLTVLVTIKDSVIQRISARSLRYSGPSDVARILWLGEASQEESFELLSSLSLSGDALRGSVYAISYHRDVRAAGPWIKRFLDPSGGVETRKTAAYSYAGYAGNEAAGVLVELALSDRSLEVAKAAAYALAGNLDSDRAVESLGLLIQRSNRFEVRKAAVYALGNADSDDARRILLRLILEES
ncbi:HEAT repeat domain-containing protein [Rhodothermus sp. AH-315-K08]|nr:HEAT repeat domain-containing protein [Rhodothermus sp. AH-315-K08]